MAEKDAAKKAIAEKAVAEKAGAEKASAEKAATVKAAAGKSSAEKAAPLKAAYLKAAADAVDGLTDLLHIDFDNNWAVFVRASSWETRTRDCIAMCVHAILHAEECADG